MPAIDEQIFQSRMEMDSDNQKEEIFPGKTPRVLIIFFSFSGQTSGLLNQLSLGLKEVGAVVEFEKLRPVNQLLFPVGSVISTLVMMLTTFVRSRVPIQELSSIADRGNYDLIILAGPTWSFNPSGPVLALLDRDGKKILAGQTVLPLISCRGYWRMHWYGLRSLLKKCGAMVPNVIAFSHPMPEPWRSIGVFLKIAGKNPEKSKIFGRHYTRYGHSKTQRDEAWRFGLQIGEALRRGQSLAEMDFRTPTALP
jgi:hypothetical protein